MRVDEIFILVIAAAVAPGTACCQTLAPDDYLRQNLTGSFVYKAGGSTVPNAPGFGVNYGWRPKRRIMLEGGFEQILHPVGAGVCCEYVTNAHDQLFVFPFGARYVWEQPGSRVRLSVGGGGVYVKYTVGTPSGGSGPYGYSGTGGQLVGSGDYAVRRSGKLRVGLTARYFVVSDNVSFGNAAPPGFNSGFTSKFFVIGPEVTFSFR